jgi:hypothetical protein
MRTHLLAAAMAALSTSAALAQPANNACANAELLAVAAGSSTSVSGTTVAATVDGATGNCGTSNATPDVWYRVVAPASGLLTASTCTGTTYNSVVSIRTACPGSGVQVACNDNYCGNQSRVVGNVTGGTTYWIRVSGFNGGTGAFTLTLSHTGIPTPTLGPDVITSNLPDVLRHGTSTDGTVTAYSVGTTSCNPGDYPCLWIDNSTYNPDFDVTRHPVISQNMYRLKSYGAYSRFEHLGQSWLKHGFVSTNSSGCGVCEPSYIWRHSTQSYQNVGGDAIGVNCSDTYGASLNGSFTYLGAKNIVHPTIGTSPWTRNNGNGDATTKMRLQVRTADVTGQPAGTRFYVDGYYVTADDAQFVRPGQTVAFNSLNNASWREVNAATLGNSSPSFANLTQQREPGIFAWRAADPSVTLVSADHDDTPNPGTGFTHGNNTPGYNPFPGTFIRSRFWVAAKVTDLGGNQWRYEFAVYNHNSDRAAGTFSMPIADSAAVTNFTFHAPLWHSGEPYSNAPWTMTKANGTLAFATDGYTVNTNANALRWGCLYNFGFTADVPPVTGSATLALFKPGTLASITVAGLPVPTPPGNCGSADFDCDGDVGTDADIEAFFACLGGSCPSAPCTGSADFDGDGDVGTDADIEAFFSVLGGGDC